MAKVLVIGKNGQLAWELAQTKPHGITLSVHGSAELDIRDQYNVDRIISEINPDVVINTAAYTAVDKAETDTEQAYAINEQGVKNIAIACATRKIRLVHISTDFVFDGSQSRPYTKYDKTNPLGVYGASKLAGENVVITNHPENSIVIRTAWVYSSHGNNFVKTMLRLMKEKTELGVVDDQIGTPTWAKGLARFIWELVKNRTEISQSPLVLNWTDAGVASWYDFAQAIQELALHKGLLKKEIAIKPIPSSSYPTPAKRPPYSVLDKNEALTFTNIEEDVHWRKQLSKMLDELIA
ncbi:dTDP-4-dehydrorhamnose reductase [Pokkaliibacter plantistimulans]|uniref:dTDP-4-dehydrorhamnose reductase n=1 Tax=Proteobacteria bacterium 228 TaxID=2083153 RepID=A0A2S5KIJ4_9PROT|nr:dTDP-4-dehydrorhamnose reductase [Pokkaliibacter plantistimulans]PPC74637.1 dTDP-4-dehydrorhamnose reductase [Pokkaliibacter plantistimulans]